MSVTTVERRYPFIRMSAGDYLLLSNDGNTLWRIYSYEEDGSLEDGTVGTFWAAAKFNEPLSRAEHLTDYEFRSWEHWDFWTGMSRTRADVVAEVLR